MSKDVIKMSPLGKTWIFDIDGTIVKHNGYMLDGHDTLLEGAKEFFDNIPEGDMVILLTSRTSEYSEMTEEFLENAGIRFDSIIYNAPYGERIIVNDRKPSGLNTSIAINTNRDEFLKTEIEIDDSL